jgi:hypothetical protein
MLTGLSIEDMYIYYAVATVHATATARSIRLFIDIPLRAADRSFTLYQTHSLHNISGNLKKFEGFEGNLRNFNCIWKEFKEIYIILT